MFLSIEQTLIKAIQERLEVVAAEEIEKCQKEIHSRMADYVASTCIRLMQHVRIDYSKDEIILRVEMPKNDGIK